MPEFLKIALWPQKLLSRKNLLIKPTLLCTIFISSDTKDIYLQNYQSIVKVILATLQYAQEVTSMVNVQLC